MCDEDRKWKILEACTRDHQGEITAAILIFHELEKKILSQTKLEKDDAGSKVDGYSAPLKH